MSPDRVMRRALQLTTVFNFVAAFALAFPASALAGFMGLPSDAPAIYRAVAAGAVGLFGGAYAWLSLQPVIDRPLVAFSAIAKLCAFGTVVALVLVGNLPARGVAMTSPDLLFALVFLWWLRGPRAA